MNTLNEIEFQVLEAVKNEIINCTGSQFGYGADIKIDGLTKNQIAGYLSQLSQKGMICIDKEFDSVQLRKPGADILGVTGDQFEII